MTSIKIELKSNKEEILVLRDLLFRAQGQLKIIEKSNLYKLSAHQNIMPKVSILRLNL